MSGYTAHNPIQLKDIILRRLGAPVIKVEITECQIYDCISRAIELYVEYHPDGLNRTFITVKLTKEQAESGIIQFDRPIFAVTKILRADSNYWTLDGTATYDWFGDFLRGLAGTPGCTSTHSVFGTNTGLSYFSQIMSYRNEMLDQLQPLDDFWYNGVSRTVRVQGNKREGDLLVFECWAETAVLVDQTEQGRIGSPGLTVGMSSSVPNIEDIWDNPRAGFTTSNLIGYSTDLYAQQGVYNVRWVKDYATVLAKEINGTILKKHQGMQLPGGITIDGQSIYDEAIREKEQLREELLSISEPLPIIWG